MPSEWTAFFAYFRYIKNKQQQQQKASSGFLISCVWYVICVFISIPFDFFCCSIRFQIETHSSFIAVAVGCCVHAKCSFASLLLFPFCAWAHCALYDYYIYEFDRSSDCFHTPSPIVLISFFSFDILLANANERIARKVRKRDHKQ